MGDREKIRIVTEVILEALDLLNERIWELNHLASKIHATEDNGDFEKLSVSAIRRKSKNLRRILTKVKIDKGARFSINMSGTEIDAKRSALKFLQLIQRCDLTPLFRKYNYLALKQETNMKRQSGTWVNSSLTFTPEESSADLS